MSNEKHFSSRADRKSFFTMKKGNKFGGKRRVRDEKQVKDRIAKRLAMLGVASRREAEKIVLDGKVKINGIECTNLAQLVSYEDKIAVNGKEIVNKPIRTQIFIMNKPAGYVTSNNDPQGRKTIFELIPSKFGRLMAIGRLDYNTEGILLLTNNGELSRIMEMPATGLKRVYYARVVGEINDSVIKKLEDLKNGIKIEGVEYGKMIVDVSDYNQTRATLRIVIFEGKNNEIRRVMWHLGLKVVKLTRVQYGDFRLNGVPEGCVQESHFRVDIRELEKRASRNIKRYNASHKKDDIEADDIEEKNENIQDDNNEIEQNNDKIEETGKNIEIDDEVVETKDETVENEVKENIIEEEKVEQNDIQNDVKSDIETTTNNNIDEKN